MKTSDLIVKILEDAGVEYIFGIPGGAIEDLNISLYNNKKIKPIVTKHEEGAAFMADGYARVSGRLGVCCSTAGPGALNMVTGIATSYEDSIPVLALTGQVATSVFGKGAFQESGHEGTDIVSMFRRITKYSSMIDNEKRARYMIQKAIRFALSGRKGPVHLSLPSDVMKRDIEDVKPYFPVSKARLFDRERVKAAASILIGAKRPVIIAGWGVILSRGARELMELALLLNIPVATSPKAKGVFPESHPLSLGVLGFAGSPLATSYILDEEVDVTLAVGTSFNEIMTSGWDKRLNPSQHLIHIDVDEGELGKNYSASLEIVGDGRTVLEEISYAVSRKLGLKDIRNNFQDLPLFPIERALNDQELKSAESKIGANGLYSPDKLVLDIQKFFPRDTIFFADMGNSMAWAIRYLTLDKPYSFFLCLGSSSMGYAVAAPVGAKLAFPERPMVSFAGDGSFLMNGFEVATAVNYNIPVVWVILNDAMLGMIYHGRKLFKEPIPEGIPTRFKRVDFVKVAEGLGARGIRIEKSGQITEELVQDILNGNQPTVLDVRIDEEVVPPIHNRIQTVDNFFI